MVNWELQRTYVSTQINIWICDVPKHPYSKTLSRQIIGESRMFFAIKYLEQKRLLLQKLLFLNNYLAEGENII